MKKIILDNKGFTLIEVVIALGVLGFGILAMFSMQAFSIRGNATASKITQEVTASANGFEKILSMEYEDVVGDDLVDAGDDEFPDLSSDVDTSLYDITWGVTPDLPIEGMMTVTVEVASKVDGKKVSMDYVRVDEDAL